MTHLALLVLFIYPALTLSGQLARMITVAFCLLCCHPIKKEKIQAPAILLLAWFAWAFLCSYLSDNFNLAIFGFHKRWEGLNTWALAIAFGWLFWRSSKLERLFVSCGTILAICLLAMIFYPDIYRRIIYGHITISAFVTVVSCMLMALHPACIAISVPFIYFTQQRSMLIGLFLGAVTYLIFNRKAITRTQWISIGIASLVALAVVSPKLIKINPSTFGTGARSQFFNQSIDLFTMKPFTGYGVDTLSTVVKPITGKLAETIKVETRDNKTVDISVQADRAHNILLDIILQTGFVGAVLLILAITRSFCITLKNQSRTNLACLCGIMGFIGFGMLNPTGIPAIFMFCLCLMGIKEEAQ